MIRYLLYLACIVLLIVVQTVIAPGGSGTSRLFDLIVPLAVYFSLYRPFREGLPVVLAAGITMDMLSAAPVGIYLTTYLWLYVAFRQTWRVVRMKQNLLFPCVVAVGVLFENAVFWIAITLTSGVSGMSSAAQTVGAQLIWAVVTAPLTLMVLHALFQIFDQIWAGYPQENGQH